MSIPSIRRAFAASCCVVFAICSLNAENHAAGDDAIDFVRDIRPILSDKCFACHGPDEHTREADLRLDKREDAESYLSPGDPDESDVLKRVLSKDPDEHMPPPESHKDLKPNEVKLLTQWIKEGAEYQEHWSFRPMQRTKLPAIKHAQNLQPIDALLLDKLGARKMNFSEPADRVTLARRLYADLLGVPPSPEEVRAFVDDKSPKAWESLVDRLLDDKRFGERMAVYWLDLVRYADTIGYHSDNFMEISAYRDYVIDAFNQNKPFDQFTIEQLAGDLLPAPTEEQKIASGYNRLLQTTQEGGAQAKEYIAIYAADRVRNVSGVWMGLTVGCAQCHDHKYDPITAKDFYSLAAFFADVKERPIGKREPNLKIVSPEQKAQADAIRKKIESLQEENQLKNDPQLLAQITKGQTEWEDAQRKRTESGESVWKSPDPKEVKSTDGVKFKRNDDGTYLAVGANANRGNYTYTLETTGKVHAVQLEIFPDDSFGRKEGFGRGNGNIVLTGFQVSANDKPSKIASAKADYEQPGWPVANTLDNKSNTGWAVDGHNKKADRHTAVFALAEPVDFGDSKGEIQIVMQHQSAHVRHLVGRFRLSITDDPSATAATTAPLPSEIVAAINKPVDKRSEGESKRLSDHYRKFATELVKLREQKKAAEKELADHEKSYRSTLVTVALDKPRMTRILPRGNWLDDSGPEVQPAVPEFLPHDEVSDRRSNRMDLAKWLFRADNPLTARTFVNRLWKMYFGRGLSRNLDDLGGQGQPPTHPELLDWLALDFQESGWDVKKTIRRIVTSGAYQQSSSTTPQSRAADPGNDWFSRQGRWRVEAEFVRDTALQLGGLLQQDATGGLSVKPYQPAGYWQHLNFPKRKWTASSGNDLYRRTLYTFWCRSFLHPSLLAFDAPSREECTAERARSNIPQQALALLNDPIYVEAARGFAERILKSGDDDGQRLKWAFHQATSRDPSPSEFKILESLLADQTARFEKAEDSAKSLVGVGEKPNPNDLSMKSLAIWTQVARAILNAYETTSRY